MSIATFYTDNRLAGTQQAIAAAYKTLVALTAATATLNRGQLKDLFVGPDGTPAGTDGSIVYDVSRQTAAGTSTAATPNPNDPAASVTRAVGAVNFTAEGTITAASSLWGMALNQRASQRWVADPGAELVWPATNLAGLALRALSPVYTGNAFGKTGHNDVS